MAIGFKFKMAMKAMGKVSLRRRKHREDKPIHRSRQSVEAIASKWKISIIDAYKLASNVEGHSKSSSKKNSSKKKNGSPGRKSSVYEEEAMSSGITKRRHVSLDRIKNRWQISTDDAKELAIEFEKQQTKEQSCMEEDNGDESEEDEEEIENKDISKVVCAVNKGFERLYTIPLETTETKDVDSSALLF